MLDAADEFPRQRFLQERCFLFEQRRSVFN
jgi:hypothetical protein